MIKESPILITGAARSGTSIIGAAINHCGAFLGETSKRAMFENIRIKEEIVKPYFDRMGVDVRAQYPLPDLHSISIPTDWKQQVEQILTDEGYKKGKWMYKGTGMGLVWPVWHYAFPNAKWIIVRRKTYDIIQSCLKTGYMNAFSDEDIQQKIGVSNESDGWLWWVRQHEKRFVEMIQEGVNCKQIWPERMVDGNYEQLYEVLDWIGLPKKEGLTNFINPLLWGRKKGELYGSKSNGK
jgi:hypothetical protein